MRKPNINQKNDELYTPPTMNNCEHQSNFGKDLDEIMIYGDKYAEDKLMCKKNYDKTEWYSTCNNCNIAKPILNTGFWFIEYDIDCELWDSKKRNQCVSDQHPFEWLRFLSKISSLKRTLVSWKEITEEEYEKGKEVLGIG